MASIFTNQRIRHLTRSGGEPQDKPIFSEMKRLMREISIKSQQERLMQRVSRVANSQFVEYAVIKYKPERVGQRRKSQAEAKSGDVSRKRQELPFTESRYPFPMFPDRRSSLRGFSRTRLRRERLSPSQDSCFKRSSSRYEREQQITG